MPETPTRPPVEADPANASTNGHTLQKFVAGVALVAAVGSGLAADAYPHNEQPIPNEPLAAAPVLAGPEVAGTATAQELSHAYTGETRIIGIGHNGVLPPGSVGNEHELDIITASITTGHGDNIGPGVMYTSPVVVPRDGETARPDGPSLFKDTVTTSKSATSIVAAPSVRGLRYAGASVELAGDTQNPDQHINLQLVADETVLSQSPRTVFDIYTTAEAQDPQEANNILAVRHYAGSITFVTMNGEVNFQLGSPEVSDAASDTLLTSPR